MEIVPLKGRHTHQSRLNFNYPEHSAESADCKYETGSGEKMCGR